MKMADDPFNFNEDKLTMPDDVTRVSSAGIPNNNNNYDDPEDTEDKNTIYMGEAIDVEDIL